jgi:hypothetical protein
VQSRRAVISRRLRFSQDARILGQRARGSNGTWISNCCSRREGFVIPTRQGIVYITTKDHVGIVAFRIPPTQGTCRIKKPNPRVDQTGEDLSYDKAMYRAYGRWKEDDGARRACDRLAIGLKKAEISGCPYVDLESLLYSQVCLGPPCKVHRGPTDAAAIYLETVDWSNTNMQGIMTNPTMLGTLVLS